MKKIVVQFPFASASNYEQSNLTEIWPRFVPVLLNLTSG